MNFTIFFLANSENESSYYLLQEVWESDVPKKSRTSVVKSPEIESTPVLHRKNAVWI